MVFFTEAQVRFQNRMRDFARNELAQGARQRASLDHITLEVIKKIADAGLLKLTTPVKYGGEPKDCVSTGIAFEEISKVDLSPMILMISHVVIPLMLESASEELKEEWLQVFGNGEKLGCFGNTEPDCGSDAGAITTSAVRDGDSYIISGEKTSVSVGMQANAVVLTAKTNPDAGAKGVTCFLVPLDLPNISRSHFVDMGFLPSARASIFLSDVRIPSRFRIGNEGEGFIKVMDGFDFTRVLAVLGGIGLAEACFDEAVDYIKEREAFGAPISRFEGVSFRLAECATLIEASRLISYNALKLRDEGLPNTKEAAMAKWFVPKCVVNTIHDCLLIFGAKGYSEANPIQQRLRDALGLRIGDGTTEIMKLIIAREILGSSYAPRI